MATVTTVDDFLLWAERDRLRSPHTLTRYRAVLGAVGAAGDPSAATEAQVHAWWESRFHLSPATRANELACLRTFYRWAIRRDLRESDPTRLLDAPKVPNHVPRPIGQADLERLMGPLTADALDLRRAVALGAYGGLRVSEAAALDWANVDQETRRIYVRGKGQKERPVALSPYLLDKLLPAVTGNVVAAGGTPVNGATLQRKVNRLMERHGIAHSFHDLRKRGATLALAKGLDPVSVTRMFGWSSIQTATAYAAVSDETLDAIAAAMV